MNIETTHVTSYNLSGSALTLVISILCMTDTLSQYIYVFSSRHLNSSPSREHTPIPLLKTLSVHLLKTLSMHLLTLQ